MTSQTPAQLMQHRTNQIFETYPIFTHKPLKVVLQNLAQWLFKARPWTP